VKRTVINSLSCFRSMRAANSRCSFALRLSPCHLSVSEPAGEMEMQFFFIVDGD
jgi:hypothetical protein